MGFVRDISQEKLRISINNEAAICAPHTDRQCSSRHIWVRADRAYFVPKVSVMSQRLTRVVFHWEDLQAAGPVM